MWHTIFIIIHEQVWQLNIKLIGINYYNSKSKIKKWWIYLTGITKQVKYSKFSDKYVFVRRQKNINIKLIGYNDYNSKSKIKKWWIHLIDMTKQVKYSKVSDKYVFVRRQKNIHILIFRPATNLM